MWCLFLLAVESQEAVGSVVSSNKSCVHSPLPHVRGEMQPSFTKGVHPPVHVRLMTCQETNALPCKADVFYGINLRVPSMPGSQAISGKTG